MHKLRGGELKVLMYCWKKSSFNPMHTTEGNIIHNDVDFKQSLRNEGLDIPDSTIDCYISRLVKHGFLIKRRKGCHILNPKYFFKGTHSDAAKMSLTFEVE